MRPGVVDTRSYHFSIQCHCAISVYVVDRYKMGTKRSANRKVKTKSKTASVQKSLKMEKKPSKMRNGRVMTRCSAVYLNKIFTDKGLIERMSGEAHKLLEATGFHHFLYIPKI